MAYSVHWLCERGGCRLTKGFDRHACSISSTTSSSGTEPGETLNMNNAVLVMAFRVPMPPESQTNPFPRPTCRAEAQLLSVEENLASCWDFSFTPNHPSDCPARPHFLELWPFPSSIRLLYMLTGSRLQPPDSVRPPNRFCDCYMLHNQLI